MDRPEEAVESVNPREQELLASEPLESNVPNGSMEAENIAGHGSGIG